MHRRLIPDISESLRRDLPAEIAVDAGSVDEEISSDVLGMAQLE
jgi:hypothetical protein